MMNSPQPQPSSLSDQDVELLSTYLDDQLTAAERVNLERRLAAEPRLRAELDDLRMVRKALNSLDPVPLPRSFTLDPAQVARPRPFFPLTWFMQLGSGLAGLALVLLASVQILAAGVGGGPAAAPMAAAQPTAAPAAEATVAPAAPAAMSASESAPAGGAASSSPAATAAPAAGAAAESAPAPPPAAMQAPDAGAGAASSERTADAAYPAETQATKEAPASPAASAAEVPSGPIGPGLTLVLGLGLIGLAVSWNVASRRRA
jgi:hypothetical protein